MTMDEILKYSFSQYVKMRFAELLRQKVNGEEAYATASGEYIVAATERARKEKIYVK